MKASVIREPDILDEFEEQIKVAAEFFTVDELVEFIESEQELLTKEAKLTTPEQRAKMKQYRQKNKAKLSMKAKRRKQKEQQGAKRKKKRIGTAAGGYTFVEQGAPVKTHTPKLKTPKVQAPPHALGRSIGHTPRHLTTGRFKVATILNPVQNKMPESKPKVPPAFPVIKPKLHPTSTVKQPKNPIRKIAAFSKPEELLSYLQHNARKIYGDHARVKISKSLLNERQLEKLGFEQTMIAIPEPGQARQESWRGPLGLHLHDHGSHWIMHQDSIIPDSVSNKIQHTLKEGLPAVKDYLSWDKGSLTNYLK